MPRSGDGSPLDHSYINTTAKLVKLSMWVEKVQINLVIVEHWCAVHWGPRVPRAELVQAVKHRAIVADVEVVQAFCETLVRKRFKKK